MYLTLTGQGFYCTLATVQYVRQEAHILSVARRRRRRHQHQRPLVLSSLYRRSAARSPRGEGMRGSKRRAAPVLRGGPPPCRGGPAWSSLQGPTRAIADIAPSGDSGYSRPPSLVRRSDGQVIQPPPRGRRGRGWRARPHSPPCGPFRADFTGGSQPPKIRSQARAAALPSSSGQNLAVNAWYAARCADATASMSAIADTTSSEVASSGPGASAAKSK